MRRASLIIFAVCIPILCLRASDKNVLGSWEGESKCVVPDSPCHDEQVL